MVARIRENKNNDFIVIDLFSKNIDTINKKYVYLALWIGMLTGWLLVQRHQMTNWMTQELTRQSYLNLLVYSEYRHVMFKVFDKKDNRNYL
jgi:hypothetical protein